MRRTNVLLVPLLATLSLAWTFGSGCAATKSVDGPGAGGGLDGPQGDASNFDVGGGGFDAHLSDGAPLDPTSCEGAAVAKSYIGCDYWPTVVANNVWSTFDYAVVVAN